MNKTEAAIKYEHYETAPWAARAILEVEQIRNNAVDPCAGSGILVEAFQKKYPNRYCESYDIFDWGYIYDWLGDFLKPDAGFSLNGTTVFMNPPFSLADKFVEHAFAIGAEKIICFQRLAWFESRERAMFFAMYPPDRIWLCGDRATSWRHDISAEDRTINSKTGKRRTGSTTAHAWFIFERGSKSQQTVIDKIWKHKGEK